MQFPKPTFMPPPISPSRATVNFSGSDFTLDRREEPSMEKANVTQLNRGQLVASKITPGQERDLNFLFHAAFVEPTATNMGIVQAFLERWKPPKEDLLFLKQSAEKVVGNYVDKPDSRAIEFSKGWENYSDVHKYGIIHDFVQHLNESLGESFDLKVISTPQVNNTVPFGYYEPDLNQIVINIHPTVGKSFGNVISTTFHEAIHGIYFNRTLGMNHETVLAKAKSGEISLTDAYAFINLTDRFYILGGEGYPTQPHEELAFSGNEFIERELRKRGIWADSAMHPSHSTIQNIRRHGL